MSANTQDKRECIYQMAASIRRIRNARTNGNKAGSTLAHKLCMEFGKHKQALYMGHPQAWIDFCNLYELPPDTVGIDLFNK